MLAGYIAQEFNSLQTKHAFPQAKRQTHLLYPVRNGMQPFVMLLLTVAHTKMSVARLSILQNSVSVF